MKNSDWCNSISKNQFNIQSEENAIQQHLSFRRKALSNSCWDDYTATSFRKSRILRPGQNCISHPTSVAGAASILWSRWTLRIDQAAWHYSACWCVFYSDSLSLLWLLLGTWPDTYSSDLAVFSTRLSHSCLRVGQPLRPFSRQSSCIWNSTHPRQLCPWQSMDQCGEAFETTACWSVKLWF